MPPSAAPRSRTSSATHTPKDLYQTASHHFLHRQHASALGSLSQLFALLPSPNAATASWASDLPPKPRADERWRSKAAELMLTAEVMLYKATAEGEAHDERKTAEHFAALERRAADLFAPEHMPPAVVLTLSRAGASLGRPIDVRRRTVEDWLAGIAPDVLPALAVMQEERAGERWVADAVKGYEDVMEHYWVELLAQQGEGEREEARRLVEWDEVVSVACKERVRARLARPPSPPPVLSSQVLPSADRPAIVSLSSFSSSSPDVTDAEPASPRPPMSPTSVPALPPPTLTNRSAYTGSLPSSPTLPSRALTPPPAPSLLQRIRAAIPPFALPPLALLLFAVFVLRRARARRVGWRELLGQWVVTAFREVALEIVSLWRLGTALTYV